MGLLCFGNASESSMGLLNFAHNLNKIKLVETGRRTFNSHDLH
jgi:hypothetical protein